MRDSYVLLLIVILLIGSSCSDKAAPQEPKPPKVLDTSFLNLGVVGTKETKASDLQVLSHIHVLKENQDITIDANAGSIVISNFDASILKDKDIIVGNSKDRFLFKYDAEKTSNLSTGLSVSQASLTDLQQESSTNVSFTPELTYETENGLSFTKVSPQTPKKGNANSALNQIIGKTIKNINPDQKNILQFKNYEIYNGNSSALGAFNTLNKSKIKFSQGGDLKISIDEGHIELIPTFRGDYNVKSFGQMDLLATFDSYLKYRFKVTVETSEKTKAELSFPLFKDLSFPIRMMAGAVPVYMDLKLIFPAGIKVFSKKKGKVTFVVENEYALNATATYNSATGAVYDSHYDYVINKQNFSVLDGDDAHYSFELFFEPKVETKMYKVLGPYAYVNTNIQTDVRLPLIDDVDDLFLNFSGGIGLNVEDSLFSSKVLNLKSGALYNFSKGWDVVGPKRGKSSRDGLKTVQDVSLQVDGFGEDGGIAIKLKPENASLLTDVKIFKQPEFGNLVLGESFALDGLAYYYPPQVIEGSDSFQIVTFERGQKSAPTRISLNFSSQARDQASRSVTPLSRLMGKAKRPTKKLKVGNMIVSSPSQNLIDSLKKEGYEIITNVEQNEIYEHRLLDKEYEKRHEIYKEYSLGIYRIISRRESYRRELSEKIFLSLNNKRDDDQVLELKAYQTRGNQIYYGFVFLNKLYKAFPKSEQKRLDEEIKRINVNLKGGVSYSSGQGSFYGQHGILDLLSSRLESSFPYLSHSKSEKELYLIEDCFSRERVLRKAFFQSQYDEFRNVRAWEFKRKSVTKKINYCLELAFNEVSDKDSPL